MWVGSSEAKAIRALVTFGVVTLDLKHRDVKLLQNVARATLAVDCKWKGSHCVVILFVIVMSTDLPMVRRSFNFLFRITFCREDF